MEGTDTASPQSVQEQAQTSSVSDLQSEVRFSETAKKASKTTKPSSAAISKLSVPGGGSTRKRLEPKSIADSSSRAAASSSSSVSSVPRRKSTGGLPEKGPASSSTATRRQNGAGSTATRGSASTASAAAPVRRSLPEIRASQPPAVAKVAKPTARRANISESRKSVPVLSATGRIPKTSPGSDGIKGDSMKKSYVKQSSSVASLKGVGTSSVDSSSSSSIGIKKAVSKVSSPSTPSRSVFSGSRVNSTTSSSLDRNSTLSTRRKAATPDSRNSRFIVLPQVEIRAGDDVRLDLRGHKVRSLNGNGLNLTPSLEFVYLRDNLLSSLEGIEILKRVKVLDLSFNNFKEPGFEPVANCKALQQLYLAGNQITSIASLPELPNLEFLSVAQNKLKSLSMARQPRLQVLAVSKNKISTLKGFPHFPVLEHLRVEENPILQKAHVEAASILLVGPTLKKFNDRDLSKEEVAIAKRYPAHSALCIRDGWEFCHPEKALDSTFSFLVEQWKDHFPPGYHLKEAHVDQPFEEDPCHCHFVFVQDDTLISIPNLAFRYRWLLGERTPTNFKEIPDAIGEVYWPKHEDIDKILKAECTPILGGTEYPSIFAISSPVSPGTGFPKVVKLDVHGELLEGSIIRGYAEIAWCGGTPGKGVASWLRRKWNSNPVVIAGAENEEYQLTMEDINSRLVFMYTPVTEEGAKGEPQYKYTDFVKAAPPSVKNVRILGDVIEGSIIKGIGDYFGGIEGQSKFEWLLQNKSTGDYELVLTGAAEYTLTKEDIGRRLVFSYFPINFEGQEGESMSIVSEVVKSAPPRATNVRIVGELRENSKVTVTGTVTGGTEGSSRSQWFKTSSPTLDIENGLETLCTSKIAKGFRIPLGAVDYYIVAKFTPMSPDGQSGEAVYVISERTVETLPPSLNFLFITGEYTEGGILTASYGYIGGHEGKSICNWYLHEAETESGTLIPEVSGILQYHITKEAIGKLISFSCTPMREDGIIGEERTCMGQERVRPGSPRLLSLHIVGNAVEGATLCVDKKYWGGEEGNSIFCWFRGSSDGTQNEIKGAAMASYSVSADDVGFCISVSCEPVRCDCTHGPTVISEQIGPIIPGHPTCESLEFLGSMVEGEHLNFIACYSGGVKGSCFHEWFRVGSNGVKEKLGTDEFLSLTLEDVGRCIELIYTPIRNDGVKGSSRSVVSDAIVAADPIGFELIIPDCCEDKEIIPEKKYFGGQEGAGLYTWYRTWNKLQGCALMEISNSCNDVFVCGKSLTYTPSLEDVGAYLALHWLPSRSDGKFGKPVVSICNSPVTPASPVVLNVSVKELSFGVYFGVGTYSGGHEGPSIFSWYRQTNEGSIVLIDGVTTRTYNVTDSDYNCRLLFGYTPVRSDCVAGELQLSEPTDIILPEILMVEMLAFTGMAIEGNVLTAVEVIPKSDTQKHVWGKYKRSVRYQWFCSTETGDERSFQPLLSQQSCSYKARLEDIGHCLRCECIVEDVFGRSSVPAYAETAPILPGIPKVNKLEIEGRGFHTNLYAVRGLYSGGKEGKSKIQWLRSMVGSPDLISLPGEIGRMFEANVDDVGYRLVAIYTPVREDGVEGQAVSASTEPIVVEPDVHREVKQKLDIGSVKFEVLCEKDRSFKKDPIEGGLERRILEVNRKRIKVVKPGSKTSFPITEIRGSYAPPFHVELFRNDQHRLRIVVDSENEVDLLVQTRHQRDLIVLIIRGLAQRFNSTSLNSLLKIEA